MFPASPSVSFAQVLKVLHEIARMHHNCFCMLSVILLSLSFALLPAHANEEAEKLTSLTERLRSQLPGRGTLPAQSRKHADDYLVRCRLWSMH